MSEPDIVAERDVLAPAAHATKFPLVGLTIGTDGYWSARFWTKSDGFRRRWCTKVRVVGKDKYSLFYNNGILSPPPRRPALQRTYDTWGAEAQNLISRLHVGVVGLGSAGSVVTEALARVGVPVVTLVDPDVVEEHNLDRLLNATQDDVGRPKVYLAKAAFVSHATTALPTVHAISESIHTVDAYRAILDCDIVFSCVDRPVARDVLNYVSQGHLVPVLDGGIAVGVRPSNGRLSSAHWRCHVSTPLHPCLRCRDQYNTSMVVLELDGSLDDPSYTHGLDEDLSARNQNVFPFTLSLASMLVNLFLRYIISETWWPKRWPPSKSSSSFSTPSPRSATRTAKNTARSAPCERQGMPRNLRTCRTRNPNPRTSLRSRTFSPASSSTSVPYSGERDLRSRNTLPILECINRLLDVLLVRNRWTENHL